MDAPAPVARPGLRWGETDVILSEEALTALLERVIAGFPEIHSARVEVRSGEMVVEAAVDRYGMTIPLRVACSRLALDRGRLRLEIDRVRALSLLPVPGGLLERLVEKAPAGLMAFDPATRLLEIDLGSRLPLPELSSEEAEFRPGELILRLRGGAAELAQILPA